MTTPADLETPALLGVRAATFPQRVGRRLLMVAMALAVAAAFAASTLWQGPFERFDPAQRQPARFLAGLLAVLVLDALFVRIVARTIADAVLGLRLLGDDGRQHGLRSMGHEALTMVMTAATVGLVPIISGLLRDEQQRTWVDRLFRLRLADVRRGRDTHLRPVRQTEIDKLTRVEQAPAPSVISVVGGPSPIAASPAAQAASALARPYGQAPTLAPTASGYRIRFDDGATHAISGSALIGRAPVIAGPDPRVVLLAVADPSGTLSKTHLRVVCDAAGLWIEDLGSTNGSRLASNGVPIPLRKGTPVLAGPGATVSLGERSFEVLSGATP